MGMNYLALVNKNNIIKDNYFKYIELVNYMDVDNNKIEIEKKTLEAYLNLKDFLKSKNIIIGISFGYKSKKNINESANDTITSLKTSEHYTGLAIDLSIKVNDKFLTSNNELEKYEDVFLEIHKCLKDFGFILRYPKTKENLTGYSYKMWHIRYVGIVPATIIYNNNLSLEEYLNSYSGVLVVNKEKGVTSRDVVNEVSHILGIKKIGHTGTLDPMAEGVLVLTIGKATKIGELLTSYTKEYIAGVKMGIITDTLDITGEILDKKDITCFDLNNLLKDFSKTYLQEVPIYSAVKVKGRKLYEYARNGIEVELPKKEVTVKDLELLESNDDSFKFRCLVSKGTYIRSLISDMGDACNNYFSMSSLVRVKQGDFSINDAYKIDDIKNNNFSIMKIEEVLNYPLLDMDNNLYQKVINGCKIKNIYNIKNKVLLKYNNELIAIYQVDGELLKIWKMIASM